MRNPDTLPIRQTMVRGAPREETTHHNVDIPPLSPFSTRLWVLCRYMSIPGSSYLESGRSARNTASHILA